MSGVDVLAAFHRLGLPSEATMSKLQSAEYAKISAILTELIEAARDASATLGHIYHTTPLPPALEQYAHDGYQRLDAAIASVSTPKTPNPCDHSWAVKMLNSGPVSVCQCCGTVSPK